MRARRAAAWLIDTGPLWLALALVGPLAFLQALLRLQEASAGIGIVDPAYSRLPIGRLAHSITMVAAAALLLTAGWAIVQLTAVVTARRTVGKSLLGLRLAAAGAEPPSRRRVLARELPRFALLAALPLVETVPRGGPAAPPAWQTYAAHAGATAAPWAALILVGGLMIAATCVTIGEVILVASDPDARTLGDRLARTRVVRSP